MTNYPTIEVTPAQVRAAQGKRPAVFNFLPENIDPRGVLSQWDAAAARIVAWAEKRQARR